MGENNGLLIHPELLLDKIEPVHQRFAPVLAAGAHQNIAVKILLRNFQADIEIIVAGDQNDLVNFFAAIECIECIVSHRLAV